MLIWKPWAIQQGQKQVINFVLGKKVIFKYEIVNVKHLSKSYENS